MDPTLVAAAIGLGLKVGPGLLEKMASGLGGGDVKDMIGEQAGAYKVELMKRREEGATFLPAHKFAAFREKFPEPAAWLDLAMEQDESITFLAVFLAAVEKRFDDPKNNPRPLVSPQRN